MLIIPRRLTVSGLGVVSALALAACGGSSKSSTTTAAPTTPGGGASSTVSLAADASGQLKFDKTSLSTKSGTVTIDMKNPSGVPHAIAVEGNGVDKDGKTVNSGGVSTVKLTLKPGTYTFYCPVPGHRAAGMEGTLTVK